MHEGWFAASLHDPIGIIKNELPKVGSSCNSLMVEARRIELRSILNLQRSATGLVSV